MSLIKTHKRGWAIAFSVIGFLALMVVPSFAMLPYMVDQAMQRLLLFGLVVALIALLGGARSLVLGLSDAGRALREGFYPVGVALVICGFETLMLLESLKGGGGVTLSPSWLSDLLGIALLCVSVGLYEEALFRVLLLGGLLTRSGGTRNGVVVSVLVSSIAFGMAHVSGSASLDPLTMAQMLLKTAQAGCIGLLFGVVYLRTRSFLGVAALHALADFFLMAPLALTGGVEGSLGGYVSGGTGFLAVMLGVMLVAVYLVAIALYAPAAVRAWKLLETLRVPQAGPLSDGWGPGGDDGRPSSGGRLPVRPSGL